MNRFLQFLSLFVFGFSVLFGMPQITELEPNYTPAIGEPGGNDRKVIIKGTGFDDTATVKFGSLVVPSANVHFISDTEIHVIAPENIVSTVLVKVTLSDDEASPASQGAYFAYSKNGNTTTAFLIGQSSSDSSQYCVSRLEFAGDGVFVASDAVPLLLGTDVPDDIVLSPDGSKAYIAFGSSGYLKVMDIRSSYLSTNVSGKPVFDPVGRVHIPTYSEGLVKYAIAPDGNFLYIAGNDTNEGGKPTFVALDLNSFTFSSPKIVFQQSDVHISSLVVTPDGKTGYLGFSNSPTLTILPIHLANQMEGTPIAVTGSRGILPDTGGILPDGTKAYFVSTVNMVRALLPIDVATQTLAPSITLGNTVLPFFFAVNPNGSVGDVVGAGGSSALVLPVNLEQGQVEPPAVSPPNVFFTRLVFLYDGRAAYVFQTGSEDVLFRLYNIDMPDVRAPIPGYISGASGKPKGISKNIALGTSADQAPIAFFTFTSANAGEPIVFDASKSYSPNGGFSGFRNHAIARYIWDFGDGHTAETDTHTQSHTYAMNGVYNVSLTVVNVNDTSTDQIYTGQQMIRYGAGCAQSSQLVTVGSHLPVTVTKITPDTGPEDGGDRVEINGTNFSADATVTIGGHPATNVRLESENDTIVATTPPGIGVAPVVVTSGGVVSTGSVVYTYLAAPPKKPVVTKVNPDTGEEGDTIVIDGNNFVTGDTAVFFGPNPVDPQDINVKSSTRLTAVCPPQGGAQTIHITVTTAGGSSDTMPADLFTYISLPPPSPVPTVTHINPDSCPQDERVTVTVTGTGFVLGATTVSFTKSGGYSAEGSNVQVKSDTKLTVLSPPVDEVKNKAKFDVRVTTSAGTSEVSAEDQFFFVGSPVILSVSPNSGIAGDAVVIKAGQLFGTEFTVKFGDAIVGTFPYSAFMGTGTLQVHAPAHAAGTVDVTITSKEYGTSEKTPKSKFTYVTPAVVPIVTAISPNHGTVAGGTPVTINGTGFVKDGLAVYFGSKDNPSTRVDLLDGVITAISPPEAAGTVDIIVHTAGGASAKSAADQFTYETVPPPVNLPTVTGVSPNEGALDGGFKVTVTGSGFVSGGTSVFFGKSNGTKVVVSSPTKLTVFAPPHVAGVVHVTVAVDGKGLSEKTDADLFTYKVVPAPVIKSITPDHGKAGTRVSIKGSGFAVGGPVGVSFGSVAATNVTVISDSVIKADVPSGRGTVNVKVTTRAGTSAGLRFTYRGR